MFSAGQPLHTISHLLRDLPQSDTGVFLTLDAVSNDVSSQNDVYNQRAVDDLGTESDGANQLELLIDDLTHNTTVQAAWISAFNHNMEIKAVFYDKLAIDMVDEIVKEQNRLNEYDKMIRRSIEEWVHWDGDSATRPDPSRPSERFTYTSLTNNNVSKFDLIKDDEANHWKTLIAQYTSINHLSTEAQAREPDLDAFVKALGHLKDYKSQSVMLNSIVQLIRAFIRVPEVANNMYPNMVIAGDPGTGKSRLASTIGAVLAKMGMLIRDSYKEASSADMIGKYVGETTIKTLNFLTANLERVVFLDEAYSLTRYDVGRDDGTPPRLSEYSKEAVDQLIQFLSQNVGRFALLVAGYETPMREEFMKANEGFDRRIPMFVTLRDYPENTMITIFQKGLGQALRMPPRTVSNFFTNEAYAMLKDVIAESRLKDSNDPWNASEMRANWKYDKLHKIFHAQAGAMVNLANETAVLLSANPEFDRLTKDGDNTGLKAGKDSMRLVLVSMAQKRWTNDVTNKTDALAEEAYVELRTGRGQLGDDGIGELGFAYCKFTNPMYTRTRRAWGGHAAYESEGARSYVPNNERHRRFIVGWKLAEQEIHNALYTTGWMAWRGGYQWNSANDKTNEKLEEDLDDPGSDDYPVDDKEVEVVEVDVASSSGDPVSGDRESRNKRLAKNTPFGWLIEHEQRKEAASKARAASQAASNARAATLAKRKIRAGSKRVSPQTKVFKSRPGVSDTRWAAEEAAEAAAKEAAEEAADEAAEQAAAEQEAAAEAAAEQAVAAAMDVGEQEAAAEQAVAAAMDVGGQEAAAERAAAERKAAAEQAVAEEAAAERGKLATEFRDSIWDRARDSLFGRARSRSGRARSRSRSRSPSSRD